MVTNDTKQAVYDNFVENTLEYYVNYDDTYSTTLSDGLQELIEEVFELYNIIPVENDLIQQFKVPTTERTRLVYDEDGTETKETYDGASNTYALCHAIDRQIAELECVFTGILLLTNLDRATGKQLDMIGDILDLTRAEAALLCENEMYFDVLEDERYRRYLKYKAYINSNDCTYDTLMKALHAILGDNTSVEYIEDENYPATIFLDVTPDEDNAIYLQDLPPIKPAGVSVSYLTTLTATIDVSMEAKAYTSTVIRCGTHYCGPYPIT